MPLSHSLGVSRASFPVAVAAENTRRAMRQWRWKQSRHLYSALLCTTTTDTCTLMTLFGKSRVQEELPDEDSHSVASREKGPPPYVYGDAAGQGASDSKASLASSDDVKGAWVDDSLEELDPEAVWLDAVKHKHGCTSVVRRGSDDVVYTATKDRRWLSSTLHLFHGSVPHDPEQRPASALPYATLKSSSIFLRETSDQIEPTEYKSRQVIRAAKWGL